MKLEGIGEDLRARVLYRDAELVVVDKPAGLPVQGGDNISVSLDALANQHLRFGSIQAPRYVLTTNQGLVTMFCKWQHGTSVLEAAKHPGNVSMLTRDQQQRYLHLRFGSSQTPRQVINTDQGLVAVARNWWHGTSSLGAARQFGIDVLTLHHRLGAEYLFWAARFTGTWDRGPGSV